ncbi:MAG: hypothetical protein KJP00_06790 [Bacteroidia bacterium]|nr:hypothetical protein [Bacteroidia bacterium]
MLTFLRKLKKSLIDSGSTKKYFLYAIGEILLVVVGILIALQINNWNQNRLNALEENRLIGGIRDKIDVNRFQFGLGMATNMAVIAAAEKLLERTQKDATSLSNSQIEIHLHNLTKRFLLGKSNATHIYDELIGSGQLGLLRSQELQKAITALKLQMQLLESYEDLQNNFVDRELSPFLNRHTDRVKIYLEGSQHDTLFLETRNILVDPDFKIRPQSGSYDALFEDTQFSNLLLELLRHTKRLVPIYERINEPMSRIEDLVN